MTVRARRSVVTAVGALAAATLPLTGCTTLFGSDDPAAAPTSTPTSSSSPESSSTSPASSSSTGQDAGRELTKVEAKEALPTKPSGAKKSTVTPGPTRRVTDPGVCLDALRAGHEAQELKKGRVALVEGAWFVPSGTDGTRYDVSIQSFSRPVGPALLDRAGAAMSDCDAFAFTGDGPDGPFDDRVLTEPRPAPAIGEQSFAARFTTFVPVDGKSKPLHIDYLDVRVGHNLVRVSQGHWDKTASFDQLETYAQEMLDNLEEP